MYSSLYQASKNTTRHREWVGFKSQVRETCECLALCLGRWTHLEPFSLAREVWREEVVGIGSLKQRGLMWEGQWLDRGG